TDNETLLGRVLANRYRQDLEEAGVGSGRHGFVFHFPSPLVPFERHIIRLRAEIDGTELPGSPLILEPAQNFDESVERMIEDTLDKCGFDGDLSRKIEFLARQLDRLVQAHAEHDARDAERAQYRHLRERWGPRPPAAIAAGGAPLSGA